jgi:hypothetical protein
MKFTRRPDLDPQTRIDIVGIRLTRDDLVSVVYSTGLNSITSLVTPKRTDRHGILDQNASRFQGLLS